MSASCLVFCQHVLPACSMSCLVLKKQRMTTCLLSPSCLGFYQHTLPACSMSCLMFLQQRMTSCCTSYFISKGRPPASSPQHNKSRTTVQPFHGRLSAAAAATQAQQSHVPKSHQAQQSHAPKSHQVQQSRAPKSHPGSAVSCVQKPCSGWAWRLEPNPPDPHMAAAADSSHGSRSRLLTWQPQQTLTWQPQQTHHRSSSACLASLVHTKKTHKTHVSKTERPAERARVLRLSGSTLTRPSRGVPLLKEPLPLPPKNSQGSPPSTIGAALAQPSGHCSSALTIHGPVHVRAPGQQDVMPHAVAANIAFIRVVPIHAQRTLHHQRASHIRQLITPCCRCQHSLCTGCT